MTTPQSSSVVTATSAGLSVLPSYPRRLIAFLWAHKCCTALTVILLVEAIRLVSANVTAIKSVFVNSPALPPHPTLKPIANTDNENRRGDVIFVHGLMGDGQTTWLADGSKEFFWPGELGNDLRDVGIWTLNYEAVPSEWIGSTLPIEGQSIRLLESLRLHKIGDRRIIFVGHSLGGIIAKQMIQDAKDLGLPQYADIAQRTRGVVFLGTPNTGSDLASYQVFLEKAGMPAASTITQRQLENNAPILMRLNSWYRNHVESMEIETIAFYETLPYKGSIVVKQASADPGIPGVSAIPVEQADHVTICKPASKESDVYLSVRDFIDTQAIPMPQTWDISLQEYMEIFNKAWNVSAEMEKLIKERAGQEVVWEGIIRDKRSDKKAPTCSISLNKNSLPYQWITCSFQRWNFKDEMMVDGRTIRVRGTISDKSSGAGTILRECRFELLAE